MTPEQLAQQVSLLPDSELAELNYFLDAGIASVQTSDDEGLESLAGEINELSEIQYQEFKNFLDETRRPCPRQNQV